MKGKKTGGRVKGTPNRITEQGRVLTLDFLREYHDSGRMQADFDALEDPRDRLVLAEKYLGYIMPKRSATDVDLTLPDTGPTLEDRLLSLVTPPDPTP